MIRYVILLFALSCGSEEAPLGDAPVVDETVGDEDVVEPTDGSDRNLVGGKEIPTAPGRTNDSVANDDSEPGAPGAPNMASDRSRQPLVSVPVEGELPGVRGPRVKTIEDLMAESAKDGDGPHVKDDALDRELAKAFMDEEFTEERYKKMTEKRSGDWKPDPNKYDDPRNYAQRQAAKDAAGK